MPHRRHTSEPVSSCTTAAWHRSQRCSDLQVRQASSRARPFVLCTQTTRCSRIAQMLDQRRGQQRPLPRLLSRAVDELEDRPAVALLGDGGRAETSRRPRATQRPMGTATPARTARRRAGPARWRRRGRARSATAPPATPRRARRARRSSACPAHGAHTALRPPTTTSTPGGGTCPLLRDARPSSSPACRSRAARRRASSTDGWIDQRRPVGAAPRRRPQLIAGRWQPNQPRKRAAARSVRSCVEPSDGGQRARPSPAGWPRPGTVAAGRRPSAATPSGRGR